MAMSVKKLVSNNKQNLWMIHRWAKEMHSKDISGTMRLLNIITRINSRASAKWKKAVDYAKITACGGMGVTVDVTYQWLSRSGKVMFTEVDCMSLKGFLREFHNTEHSDISAMQYLTYAMEEAGLDRYIPILGWERVEV